MSKRCVQVPDGPPPAGPYSHAVVAGSMVFASGQIPVGPEGEICRGTVKEQAHQALENLQRVLAAAGCSLADVVKVTAYLVDMRDFGLFNEAYTEFFTSNFPARTCIEASRLPKDVQVELEAIAVLPS